MLNLKPSLMRKLIKSKARYRIVECYKKIKTNIIFELINNEKNICYRVLDGRMMKNYDWELFVQDNNGELIDVKLSKLNGFEIRQPALKELAVSI